MYVRGWHRRALINGGQEEHRGSRKKGPEFGFCDSQSSKILSWSSAGRLHSLERASLLGLIAADPRTSEIGMMDTYRFADNCDAMQKECLKLELLE